MRKRGQTFAERRRDEALRDEIRSRQEFLGAIAKGDGEIEDRREFNGSLVDRTAGGPPAGIYAGEGGWLTDGAVAHLLRARPCVTGVESVPTANGKGGFWVRYADDYRAFMPAPDTL